MGSFFNSALESVSFGFKKAEGHQCVMGCGHSCSAAACGCSPQNGKLFAMPRICSPQICPGCFGG